MNSHTKLQTLLKNSLAAAPGKVAIRTQSVAVNYRDLDIQIRRVAEGLRQHGIKTGDRVAWLLPNCIEAVLTTLACYQIGAIAVPLNHRYVAEETLGVVKRTSAKILIVHEERRDLIQQFRQDAHQVTTLVVGGSTEPRTRFESLLLARPMETCVPVPPDHPALLLFTSGSTGEPKGVVHTHQSAYCGVDVSRQIFDFQSDDTVLVGKPISHAGGLQTQLMPTLLAGGAAVLAMKPDPADAVSLIEKNAVTEYGMLASDLLDFIEYLELNHHPLPTLNNAIGSGDCVPKDLHQRFRDLFGWEVMEAAGMTEIGGYYSANPRYGKRKWGSLGVPTPQTNLMIADENGNACDVGIVGEILLKTPAATIGYWNDIQATNSLFKDDWLHTGDLARRDEDGYIWFVGRKKLMIIRRGSNIAPAEVENVIDRYSAVHASVVVGVPDGKDGQIPVACIALLNSRQDLVKLEKELRDFVTEHLAEYKNPVHYLFLAKLPRTATGKFDRRQLLEIAENKIRSQTG